MADLLTAAQMRGIERDAIESGAVTGLELMERAGRGVVEAVFEEWPDLATMGRCAVVLCGPGNNGGDGFVVARLLKERGWEVEVFLYGDPDKLPPDARVNYERWGALGQVAPLTQQCSDPWRYTLKVDAVFGTGLRRRLEEDLIARVLSFLPEADLKPEGQPPFVVSVDLPTGLSSDTGSVMPAAVKADLTVTFHGEKLGHVLGRGPEFCGVLKSVPIGLTGIPDAPVRLITPPFGWLSKRDQDHKYAHGHALILSGPSGQTGAARLAARGALRIGAGLVTIGAPTDARVEIAARTTAIMQRQVEGAGDLEALLVDPRFNALCLGPGLGMARARELVPAAVRAEHAPYVVLDADALTAFADAPQALFDLCAKGRVVMTPHGGEFARLFPDISEKLNAAPTNGPAYSKVDATREAAKRANAVVLLKGPDTVIAHPDGRASVNAANFDRAAPWLATAGSGDVLAGFVSGLLARGIAPMQAAETAAWLHVECGLGFGPGLIAEDIAEELPRAFQRLGV